MISNQILQNTIDGLKGITRIDLCVLDMEGQTLASTEAQPENFGGEVAAFISSPADSQVVHGYQFFKVFDENQLDDGGTAESGRSGIGAGSGTGSEPDRSQRGWHELGNKDYGIYQSDHLKSWN